MVALDITETSLALAVAGGYISVVGLVSYFVKEKLFMCALNYLHLPSTEIWRVA
jgi:hypothetical protein